MYSEAQAFQSAQAPTVEMASAQERMWFIRKVYLLLSAMLLICMGTVAAAIYTNFAFEIAQSGTSLVLWIGAIILSFGIYFIRKVPVVNLLALGAMGVILGLAISPLVAIANLVGPGESPFTGIVGQAFMLTTAIFVGLTSYVFITRKDFSWMGGMLFMGLLILIVSGLAFIFIPVSQTVYTIYLVAGVLIFTGYILYDTSLILHHLSTDEYVVGALNLFFDFVILFIKILQLLMLERD